MMLLSNTNLEPHIMTELVSRMSYNSYFYLPLGHIPECKVS
jgi:hypothetical protein